MLVGLLALPSMAAAQHTNGGGAPSVGTASPSGGGGGSSSGSSGGGSASNGDGNNAAPSIPSSGGRRAGNATRIGTASRGSVPGSGGTIVITEGSGFYPWGWGYEGGAIAGGYYGGYYGAYDPWYGWFPTYAPAPYAEGGPDETGGLRLKVKPNDASVYVDGFYVGVVDDFDNAFQKLKLEPGPHHIEIRSPQHRTLAVDVMIQEDFTITYRGELKPQ
jgi:hypothetical protein